MAVTVVNAGSADGDIGSQNATYSTARNGGTFAVPVNSANEIWQGQFIFGNYACYEGFIDFPLTGIPAGNIVESAVLETYLVTDNSITNFTAIAVGYDWGASVTSADWRAGSYWAGQTWWTNIPTNGIGATGSYKAWADTSDIRELLTSLAGTEVNFVLTTDRQVAGLTPGDAEYVVWASAATANPPRLTITHGLNLVEGLVPTGGLDLGGTVDIEFEFPGEDAAAVVAITVEVDADNDGEYDQDMTGLLLAGDTLTGRDYPSSLTGKAGPGIAKFMFLKPPFDLPVGVKIRARTTASGPATPPLLLARDRFNRADAGALGTTETGQTWTDRTTPQLDLIDQAAEQVVTSADLCIATIDVGVTDHYVQAALGPLWGHGPNFAGVVVRWTDANNYSYARISPTSLQLRDVAGGTDSQVGTSYSFDPYDGVVIGCGVAGQTITAYIDGVAVKSGTLTGAIDGEHCGLLSFWFQFVPVTLDDFYVFDRVHAEVEGILWTGDIKHVRTHVPVGAPKYIEVEAEGILGRLAEATVDPPRSVDGNPTGHLVGNVAARAGLLHPPMPLDVGIVTTGPVGLNPGNGLAIARAFEETERGFLHETQEGTIGYQSAGARDLAPSLAWFSDDVAIEGQYPYSLIEPLDEKSQIFNRVTAGVAPAAPTGISRTVRSSNTAIFTPNPVAVLLPTVADKDLLIVVITSSVATNGEDWITPLWWEEHRNAGSAIRTRVYSHPCDGTETGTTPVFYSDTAGIGGAWIAHIIRIEGWYESSTGLVMVPFKAGKQADPLAQPWGRAPTLFIACLSSMTSSSGGGLGTTGAPVGYGANTGGTFVNGANDGADVALSTTWKIDIVDAETATAWTSHTGFLIEEASLIGVRGYNGPHTLATLANTATTGGTGLTVTVDDTASQDQYNVIRDHPLTSNLFALETDALAYGLLTVADFGHARPVFTLTFHPSSKVGLLAQAIARRVGDKITVTAAHDTDLDTRQDFFIEAINHLWPKSTRWTVVWQLSPA
jgi:hypothetical protein